MVLQLRKLDRGLLLLALLLRRSGILLSASCRACLTDWRKSLSNELRRRLRLRRGLLLQALLLRQSGRGGRLRSFS